MKKKKRKNKKKLKLKTSSKLILILLIVFIIYFYDFFGLFNKDTKPITADPYKSYKNVVNNIKYTKCIETGITEENFNEETINKKNELINYINKNNILYYYHDKDYNYDIKRNENESIYGASLVKLSTALYLIDNDIDLSQEVTYLAKYKTAYSKGMEKHSIGDKVSLKELMKYSITYSDNTAHHMILEFIGKDKLKEYSKSLGAKVLLDGWDDFGNQTADDMNIYLNKAYELFTAKENGKLLQEYMNNTDTNALNLDENTTFLHKYGSHMQYFHDVGIYMGSHPYNIVILTTKTEANGPSYVKKVSELTYNFHNAYYDNLESYCHSEAFDKD